MAVGSGHLSLRLGLEDRLAPRLAPPRHRDALGVLGESRGGAGAAADCGGARDGGTGGGRWIPPVYLSIFLSFFLSFLSFFIYIYIHTYLPTYLHTYIHTYIYI